MIHGDVVRELRHLDPSTRNRILGTIQQLREDPSIPRPSADIRKLNVPKDSIPLYRLRVGEYRVIFAIQGTDVLATELVHRSQAYRSI